jgi:hypothetical protein
LTAYVDHEVSRGIAFKELIKYHDETVTFIDGQRVKVEKMEAQANTKVDQLQEAKRILETKKLQLSMFYKGLFFFSIPLNARARATNIRKMLSNYASTLLVTSHTLQTLSTAFLTDLGISPTQAISETSQTLDLLSLKPLDEPPGGLPGPSEGIPAPEVWVESLYQAALGGITAPGFISPNKVGSSGQSSPMPPPFTPTYVATQSIKEPPPSSPTQAPSAKRASSTNPFDDVGEIVQASPAFTDTGTSSSASSSSPTKPSGGGSSSAGGFLSPSTPAVNQNILSDLVGGGGEKKEETRAKSSSLWG